MRSRFRLEDVKRERGGKQGETKDKKTMKRDSQKGINVEFFCSEKIDLYGNSRLKSALFRDGVSTG